MNTELWRLFTITLYRQVLLSKIKHFSCMGYWAAGTGLLTSIVWWTARDTAAMDKAGILLILPLYVIATVYFIFYGGYVKRLYSCLMSLYHEEDMSTSIKYFCDAICINSSYEEIFTNELCEAIYLSTVRIPEISEPNKYVTFSYYRFSDEVTRVQNCTGDEAVLVAKALLQCIATCMDSRFRDKWQYKPEERSEENADN